MTHGDTGWFARPRLERVGPDRRARNFYRSAASGGPAIGGIPLDSTEAAVVAAVRMAYRVAEVQIERSARLARRLREEGDRAAGPRSDRQALDATERLVFRAMMSLLSWVEGAASDRGNPLKRLAVAQYRLLGSLLNLAPADGPQRRRADRPVERSSPRERAPRFPVRIQLSGPERRPVRLTAWEYGGDTSAPATIPVVFYHVDRASVNALEGALVIGDQRSVTLRLTTSSTHRAGRWRAALCDDQGYQVGRIEIML
jgi:hypothetical protein